MNTITKDKALEDLFLAARPRFADQEAFMASLNKRLDAVEYLKLHEEACLRRYQYGMLIAFALGILCGGGMLAFVLHTPIDMPLFTFSVQNEALLVLQQHSSLIATVLLSSILCLGIIKVVLISQDLIAMKQHATLKKHFS